MPSQSKHVPEEKAPLTILEFIANMFEEIPSDLLQTRKQGGSEITFVPWHVAHWLAVERSHGLLSYEVLEVTPTNKGILVKVRYTFHGADGTIWMDGTGYEQHGQGWGGPLPSAESQAARRALARFGLGLYLYQGDN